MPKLPSPTDAEAEIEKIWEPYISALGRVAHSWNHLQDALGHLFIVIANLDNTTGFAIWYSTQDDRAQRRMLRAAIEKLLDEDLDQYPTAKDDLLWITDEANKIANKRNDAIHAPCSMIIGDEGFEIIPVQFYGHPRARNLSGKDILKEFEWYERQADTLAKYARVAATVLSSHSDTWPEKPLMPTLGQHSIHRESRRSSIHRESRRSKHPR